MNFLGFPFLVQEEILRNFSNTEKVLLSLCSTKSSIIIRNLKLRPKKVQYTLGTSKVLDDPSNAVLPSLTIQVSDKNGMEEEVLVFQEYVYPQFSDQKTMLFSIGGIGIRLRYLQTNSFNTLCQLQYLKITEDWLISRIQDHTSFIFPRSHDKQLIIKSSDRFETFEMFSNLQEFSLEFGNVTEREFDILMELHPEMRDVQLKLSWNTFLVRDYLPLRSIDKLTLFESNSRTTEEVLENFNGRYLWLNKADGDTKLFMDFVRKWIFEDGFDDIKGIEVLAGDTRRFRMWADVGSFARRNRAMTWDQRRRPQYFQMRERMINAHHDYQHDTVQSMFLNKQIDCGHFFDVQQNNGQKLASFFISRLEFKFLVWENTEWNRD